MWAFTTDEITGRGNRTTSSALSARAFADMKVAGLKSQDTVRKYRRAWKLAIDNGVATDVKPGDLIDLPDVEWQPYFNPESTVDFDYSNDASSSGAQLDIPPGPDFKPYKPAFEDDYEDEEDDRPYDPIPMDPFVSWMKDLTRVVEKGYRVRMDLALKGDKNTMRPESNYQAS